MVRMVRMVQFPQRCNRVDLDCSVPASDNSFIGFIGPDVRHLQKRFPKESPLSTPSPHLLFKSIYYHYGSFFPAGIRWRVSLKESFRLDSPGFFFGGSSVNLIRRVPEGISGWSKENEDNSGSCAVKVLLNQCTSSFRSFIIFLFRFILWLLCRT